MNLLSRFKLGPRLGAAFALLVMLLVGSVAFSIAHLAKQNSQMEYLVSTKVGALLSMQRLESLTNAVGVAMRNSILADRGEAIKSELALAKTLTVQIAEVTLQIEAAEGAASEVMQELRVTQQAFLDGIGRLETVVRSGDNDAARALLVSSEMVAAQTAYSNSIARGIANVRGAMELSQQQGAQAYGATRALMIVLAVGAALLAAAVGFAITRSVLQPARQAIDSAHRIARGDLTQDVVAEGNDEMAELIAAMQVMQSNLRRTVLQIRDGATQVRVTSKAIAEGSEQLSTRTLEQSGSLQQTAASMEQMSSAVHQNASAALQANKLASSASTVASRGGTVVAEVVVTMHDINASSKKIGDIVGVIDSIAFQTNLLALNAAVEAARAGEQGLGFAVVANEVRSLAQRSAEAARQIKTLITASVGNVESGSLQVQNAGATMDEIVASVKRVSDIISEIASATSQQSSGIEQVNLAVNQLDQMTQENSALVGHSTAAAQALSEQAQKLADVVSTFRLSSEPQSEPHRDIPALPLEEERLTSDNYDPHAAAHESTRVGRHPRAVRRRAGEPANR